MLNHWMNAGCEINRIKTENTCEWWFIHQLLMTWRPMECFHIQIYLAFFNWNMFSTNTKTTEGIFLTYNSVKPVSKGQKSSFILRSHSTSWWLIPVSDPVSPASTSFTGSRRAEGSGTDSSIASGSGVGVSLALANSTWGKPKLCLQ